MLALISLLPVHLTPTEKTTQVVKSVSSGTHILTLVKNLMKNITGFEVQGALLVQLTVLVCIPILFVKTLAFAHNSLNPQRFIYANNSSDTYWPSVNKQLENLEKEGAEVWNKQVPSG